MIIIDVKDYVEDEILKLQIKLQKSNYEPDKYDKEYLTKLENLTDNDFKEIDELLEIDDDLRDFINEEIDSCIYHCLKNKYNKRNGDEN